MERLSTKEVKDYLKTVITCDNWYIGKRDENKEKSITLFSNKRELEKISKFNKLQTYSTLPITLLLVWSKNYNLAEVKANDIYDLLDKRKFSINGFSCFTETLNEGPIDLGSDDSNNYKFSIEINIYYTKNN